MFLGSWYFSTFESSQGSDLFPGVPRKFLFWMLFISSSLMSLSQDGTILKIVPLNRPLSGDTLFSSEVLFSISSKYHICLESHYSNAKFYWVFVTQRFNQYHVLPFGVCKNQTCCPVSPDTCGFSLFLVRSAFTLVN